MNGFNANVKQIIMILLDQGLCFSLVEASRKS